MRRMSTDHNWKRTKEGSSLLRAVTRGDPLGTAVKQGRAVTSIFSSCLFVAHSFMTGPEWFLVLPLHYHRPWLRICRSFIEPVRFLFALLQKFAQPDGKSNEVMALLANVNHYITNHLRGKEIHYITHYSKTSLNYSNLISLMALLPRLSTTGDGYELQTAAMNKGVLTSGSKKLGRNLSMKLNVHRKWAHIPLPFSKAATKNRSPKRSAGSADVAFSEFGDPCGLGWRSGSAGNDFKRKNCMVEATKCYTYKHYIDAPCAAESKEPIRYSRKNPESLLSALCHQRETVK